MKINIQNLEHNLLEVEGKVETDFLEPKMREFYPQALQVHVKLDQFGKDYKIDVTIQTQAHYVCDRCLKGYKRDFSAKLGQVYHTGTGEQLLADSDVVELPVNATEIDTDPLLREAIYLNHPVKMLCQNECKGICPVCGVDLNLEECSCSTGNMDPRWAELKKIIK